MARTYVLTKVGSKASASGRSGLPAHYRQILQLIGTAMEVDEIHRAMRSHSREQVDAWLDELDTLGFITPMPDPSGSGPFERWRLAIR